MNLRWVQMAHLRVLRQRWTRTLLSIVAVGAGTALAVGVLIADHSVSTSLAKFSNGVSMGAAYRIEGPADHGSLDASVLPKVASTPGVRAAVPLIMTVAQTQDSRGHVDLVPVIGFDCSIQDVIGSFGCDQATVARSADAAAVVGPALQKRLGPNGVLRTDLADLPTAGAYAPVQLDKINGGNVAVFPLPAAQKQFMRPNGLDAILVLAQPHTDLHALAAALGEAVGPQNHVFAATTPIGGGFGNLVALLSSFLFLISLIGLVIGAQLVRNTLDLSLEERRRELATSAALGATPRDIVGGILLEGAIVGALGSVIAVAGGVLIAQGFVSRLSVQLAQAAGLTASVSVPGSAVVIGFVVAVVVSVAASVQPARRAAKLDLVSELSGRSRFSTDGAASNRGLWISTGLLGLTMVVGFLAHRGGSLDAWQPSGALVALVGSMVIGYVLCVQLAPRLLTLLQRAPGFSTGPTRMAVTNIVRARRRTTAVAIAITAPVFFSTILGGVAPGIATAARGLAVGTNGGSVYVSTLPSNNSAGIDSKVTPAMEAALRAVPGVARLEHQYFAAFSDPAKASLGMFSVEAFDGHTPHQHVYRGSSPDDAFARGEVMVGPALARAAHLKPGDTFTIAGRLGPRQPFVVGGIWASPDNLGHSVTMRADQLFALTGPRPAANLSLVPAPGVSAGELEGNVRAAHVSDRLRVFTADELAGDFSKEFRSLASSFDALRIALVFVALVATGSTLVLAAAQRRRDNATLAALGMGPLDLARTTIIETIVTALGVTVVATACAQLPLLNFTWASGLTTGLAMPYRFSLAPVAAAAAAATLIGLAGAVLPAWRTARTDVMEALRTA